MDGELTVQERKMGALGSVRFQAKNTIAALNQGELLSFGARRP